MERSGQTARVAAVCGSGALIPYHVVNHALTTSLERHVIVINDGTLVASRRGDQ